jgi:hypothetical protein
MPQLSLTQLVDVVSKSGTPKANCVKKIKHQMDEPYDPATDYYKGIREALIAAHQEGLGKAHITEAAASAYGRKIDAYEEIATAYKSWWGKKEISWFDPPRAVWEPDDIFGVAVNPELGLCINGSKHVIKLYFKSDTLAKNRVDIITHLMHDQLSDECADCSFSVLDVRNKKLHTIEPPAGLGPVLVAEMAYVAALWPSV